MAIVSITVQPGNASTWEPIAAYRPIRFTVTVTAASNPPVVYCDIYFRGVFYKTLCKTVPTSADTYDFDIQDAAQEFLTFYIASASTDIGKYHLATPVFAECYCKFRVSSIDANGFIVPQTTVPIQATDTTAATAGTGTQSHTFAVINATLQHESLQDLRAHLTIYRTAQGGTWSTNTLPLSHRPINYKLCRDDIDYFAIYTDQTPANLFIDTIDVGGSTSAAGSITLASGTPLASNVFYIPNGPKNLAVIFPTIDWTIVVSYTIKVRKSDNTVIATYKSEMGCCCNTDKVRLHFRNALGTMDAMNFIKPQEEHFNNSGSFQKPLNWPLVKTDRGTNRGNVKSNEKYTGLNHCYLETNKDWIIEMLDATEAQMEWTGTEGQANSYLPVVIQDSRTTTIKANEKYFYDYTVEFIMGNENINIRN